MQVSIIMTNIRIIIIIIPLHQQAQSKGQGNRRVMENLGRDLGQESLCSEKRDLGLRPKTLS